MATQTDLQHISQSSLGGSIAWTTDEKLQLNAHGQLVIRYRQVADSGNDAVLIEKHLYRSADGRPEYIYYYAHNPANEIDQATLKRVVKYEYDANGFQEYEKVSPNGTTWTTKARYVRDANGRLSQSYVYYDNDTSYRTDFTYDDDGRITKIEQPTVTHNTSQAGGQDYRPTTEFTYDAKGNLATETDPTGIVTKYLYGYNDGIDNDNDDTTDEADGTEGFERTKVIADYGDASHLNLTTVYTYTKQNNQWRLTAVQDPKGNTTAYTVNAWGLRLTDTTPEGYLTTWTYDKNGRVTEVMRQDNANPTRNLLSKDQTTYDVFGNAVMTKSDPDGANLATIYRYDNAGRLREIWTRVYNASVGQEPPTGTIYGNKLQHDYQYTTSLVSETRQGAHASAPVKVASYTYDAFGMTTKVRRYRASDNDYFDTDSACDFQGRLVSVDGPAGEFTEYGYDQRDLTIEVKSRQGDANGSLLAYSKTYYDEAGRAYKTEAVNPDHAAYTRATNYYLDKAGRTKRVTDPGGHNSDQDYDTAGRLYKVTDHAGNRTVYTLDPVGRQVLVQTIHELGDTDRVELAFTWFDDDGRATTVANYGTNEPANWDPPTDPPAWNYANWPAEPASSSSTCLVSQYGYGYAAGTGPLMDFTDPAGTVARTTQDRLGRVGSVVEDQGSGHIERTTTYLYDQCSSGNYYDSITAANGAEADQVTKFWHTDTADASAVTKITYPETGEVTYAFGRDGIPVTRTDQRAWTTTYTADGSGWIAQESISGTGLVGTSKVTAAYDGIGRLTQVTDNNGKVSDEYSKVTYGYAWDDDTAETTITETHYLNGSQIGAVAGIFNTDGMRSKLTYPNSRYITFSHDGLHRLDTITDDDSTVLADYDYKGYYLHQRDSNGSALRLTSQFSRKPTASEASCATASRTLNSINGSSTGGSNNSGPRASCSKRASRPASTSPRGTSAVPSTPSA